VKNSLGSNWAQRTPTLNIEWGQIDPKGNRRVKHIHNKYYLDMRQYLLVGSIPCWFCSQTRCVFTSREESTFSYQVCSGQSVWLQPPPGRTGRTNRFRTAGLERTLINECPVHRSVFASVSRRRLNWPQPPPPPSFLLLGVFLCQTNKPLCWQINQDAEC